MNWIQTKQALSSFRDYLVTQSRRNLSLRGIKSNSKLYKSIKGIVRLKRNRDALGRFSGGSMPALDIYMTQYAKYVDGGVKGTHDKDTDRNQKRYKFNPSKKAIDYDAAEAFVNRKRIRLRDSKGRFLNKRQTVRGIASAIHAKGIKRSLFLTKPFNRGYKKLVNNVAEGAANDITNEMVKQIKLRINGN